MMILLASLSTGKHYYCVISVSSDFGPIQVQPNVVFAFFAPAVFNLDTLIYFAFFSRIVQD